MNRLSELRNEKKMKQDDLAKLLSVDINTISRYEREASKMVNIKMEEKICDYFGCSLDYLRGRSDIKNEVKQSEDLKLISNMIIGLYTGNTKNEQELSDKQLAHFKDFVIHFKELLQSMSNCRIHL